MRKHRVKRVYIPYTVIAYASNGNTLKSSTKPLGKQRKKRLGIFTKKRSEDKYEY